MAGSLYFVSDLLGFWDETETPGETEPAPTVPATPATKEPATPSSAADQTAIVQSLNQQQNQLGTLCGIAEGTVIQLRLIVESDGTVRSAEAVTGGDKGSCVADRIAKGSVARAGEGPVAVDLGLRW